MMNVSDSQSALLCQLESFWEMAIILKYLSAMLTNDLASFVIGQMPLRTKNTNALENCRVIYD